jgi:hypothetical protein
VAARALATMTPEHVPVAEPVFFPAGVADPEGRAGYLADGEGIVAVGLSDGRALWRSERAEQPLISDGDRLSAASRDGRLPNVLRVVVLDAAGHGDPVLVSDPVVLPEWVTVSTERRGTFRMKARLEGTKLRLEWEAHARYEGGAAPPPHVRRAAARDAAGGVEVDLDSGTVASRPIDAQRGVPMTIRRPPLAADELTEPWLAGTTVARLVWDVGDSEQILALETSDPSARDNGAAVELTRGHGLVAQVTPDGCHVLVHQEPAAAGHGPWWVFSAQTGRRVATLTHDAGARSPAIVGGRAFYLVESFDEAAPGRLLRARDLASDTLQWELPLAGRRRSAAPRLRH